MLAGLLPAKPEVLGLLALMLLHDARRADDAAGRLPGDAHHAGAAVPWPGRCG